MHAIKCSRISKQLGGKLILDKVSFEVNSGDIFGYLGPNGAGKTTTIRILLGLYDRTLGELAILGQPSPGTPELLRRIGFVLDADGLYDNLTATDNLAFYGDLYGVRGISNRCAEVLKLVGLTGRAQDRVKVFSTGMRQRLALARAILHKPKLLILDEPTSGVDPGGQAEVRNLIRELAAQGTTILLSSHNLDEVQRICNRVAFISGGKIRLTGETAQLMKSPDRQVAIQFAAPPPAAACEVLTQLGHFEGEGDSASLVHLTLNNGVSNSTVISRLIAAGAQVDEVQRSGRSLNQLYTAVMQEDRL